MKVIELKPIKESTQDYEQVEKQLQEIFKKNIYIPLLKSIGYSKKTIQNSRDDLLGALQTGRITFNKGTFSGKFNAAISKELKALGAKWDRKDRTFKMTESALPIDVKNAISASSAKFVEKVRMIDDKLARILPAEIADQVKVQKFFDSSLWKVDRDFVASVKGITLTPNLTSEQRKRISDEWNNNMKLWVEDFTKKEIQSLRKDVQASVFAGNRYESLIGSIQKSYGVSERKAKFLARQETSLLMTKHKEVRYADAGIMEYKWTCVAGSTNHPVRPMHKALGEESKKGKIYRWDNPPVTNEKGDRNNPGEDYNCRCYAIPVVRFK